jgi:chemotaxis signal transduction protein
MTIRRRRGRDLARELIRLKAEESSAELVSLLLFSVGGDQFAVRVEDTEGVVECPLISPLPYPPRGIIGVAGVKGRMTLVVDLSSGSSQQRRRRLILVKGDAQLGLLADRADQVIAAKPERLIAADQKGRWPVRLQLEGDAGPIPVIDVELLAESL